MKIPTDLELLNAIYKRYYNEYIWYPKDEYEVTQHPKDKRIRSTKNFVPIDCLKIAEDLGVDGDIVFGRLYLHLNKKYGYENKDGSSSPFFTLKIANDDHCVNFPLLSSALASLKSEDRKFNITNYIALAGVFVTFCVVIVTALMAEKSARLARESVDVFKRSIEIENRPYLYIGSPEGNKQEAFSIDIDSNGCINKVTYYRVNIGKHPAVIQREVISGDIFKDEIESLRKRVDVFPGKPLDKFKKIRIKESKINEIFREQVIYQETIEEH
jgi:hypothetical protein